jgi:AAA family ATP:ADP antiporter
VGAVVALMSANAYAHVGRIFPGESEERALGAVAVAAVLGGMLGSWIAQRASAFAIARYGWRFEIVRDNLMIGMAAVILALVPVAIALSRRMRAPEAATEGPVERPGFRTALLWIREDSQLLGMALLVVAAGVADTVGKYLFYWLVSEQFQPDPAAGRTLYFATFYAWLNGASLLMLAFGASRVIRRVGLVVALASLPLALFLGTAFLTLNTVLVVMYALRVVDGAMHSALYDPAVERLHLSVQDSRRRIVRPILSGLVARSGEGIGAVVVLALVFGVHVSLRQMLWLYLAVLVGWVLAAVSLGARLRQAPSADGQTVLSSNM